MNWRNDPDTCNFTDCRIHAPVKVKVSSTGFEHYAGSLLSPTETWSNSVVSGSVCWAHEFPWKEERVKEMFVKFGWEMWTNSSSFARLWRNCGEIFQLSGTGIREISHRFVSVCLLLLFWLQISSVFYLFFSLSSQNDLITLFCNPRFNGNCLNNTLCHAMSRSRHSCFVHNTMFILSAYIVVFRS